MVSTTSRKTLCLGALLVLIGIFSSIHSAHAQPRGDYLIVLYNLNPNIPDSGQHDCLFNDINGLVVFRWAVGTGAAGQKNCGFENREAQLRDGRSVWTIHLVEAPGKTNPAVKRRYFILESKDAQRCMISERDGDISQVSLMKFPGAGPVCGTTLELLVQDRRALWNFTGGGAIQSYATGKCLIFGNKGANTYASLFLWSENPAYSDSCGLPRMLDLEISYEASFLVKDIE